MVIGDRYELDHPIGKGGMGEVWAGHDRQLDRKIAVKFIRLVDGVPDEELERRFLREARIMARLEHTGAPTIYDAGVFEDQQTGQRRLFQAMQFIHGNTVADLVAEIGPLPIGWAAGIAAQVCAVLHAAHGLSILHRDLKPTNLMLSPDGAVKVLDFGLAILHDANLSRYTRTGQIIGTASYMPPEQIRAAVVGPQTDLYALGCVLHEMLTATRPFTGPTDYDVIIKQVTDQPPPIRNLRPDVPAALESLVLNLLEKRTEDRPADAATVYDQLTPFASGTQSLPGFLSPRLDASPVRMYARMLTDMASGPEAPAVAQIDQLLASDPEQSRLESLADLQAVRAQATSLVRESRYSQAVEILAGAVGPASRLLGMGSSEVLSLRLELADVLFEGGDYWRAIPEYRALAEAFVSREGADGDLVFHCRRREANCRAMAGESSAALRQLSVLLEDELRIYGDADLRPMELRKQIGLLQHGAGDSGKAQHTLAALQNDLMRLNGSGHPMAVEIRRLLEDVRRNPEQES
ncbi:Serine/threonine protein kinase [Streptosporangium subroseum]|uniref:non-specific serine/threonine protein kinase n=1 Tax=Streptosporangium subroseum TaxID=106412 RepID=A0A239MKU3_9ACTN|nr:serine/threonine-protein kinase [Streptosporangium subroseum]SNT42598.1 Serine/threonine protein kinase [Streptosporangium subroseum]